MTKSRDIIAYLTSLPDTVSGGDYCVMFAALNCKRKNPELQQVRTSRPRGNRTINYLLKREYGIRGVPIWGASAVRGDLNDDKEHIRRFIDLVNGLEEEQVNVNKVWDSAVAWFKAKMNAEHPPIEINPEGGFLDVVSQLCAISSGGIIQQRLCEAAATIYCRAIDSGFTCRSKRTFAGDAQSGEKGDIQIVANERLVCVVEVKAHEIDEAKIQEIMESHGLFDYPLVIAADGYKGIQPAYRNVILVKLRDFIQILIVFAAMNLKHSVDETAKSVLLEYNNAISEKDGRDDLKISV